MHSGQSVLSKLNAAVVVVDFQPHFFYCIFSTLRDIYVIKTECCRGGGGFLTPLTDPLSINNYTVVFSGDWIIFQIFWNGILSCWCRRQGVIRHWCDFCDEGTEPKKSPIFLLHHQKQIFVEDTKWLATCYLRLLDPYNTNAMYK